MHAPLASLAAKGASCTGDLPPPLVGASVTLIDSGPGSGTQGKICLFGGRLVSTRRMVSDLYELDLETLVWTRLSASSQPHAQSSQNRPAAPQPRYFHSSEVWQGKLVIFGGMGYQEGGAGARPATPSTTASSSEDKGGSDSLCVLDDVIVYDLETRTWDLRFGENPVHTPSSASSSSTAAAGAGPNPERPMPRYAHLSSITGSYLVVVGGQNMANQYVEEINVFDLDRRRWVAAHRFTRQCGSYRSLAVAPRWRVEPGGRRTVAVGGNGAGLTASDSAKRVSAAASSIASRSRSSSVAAGPSPSGMATPASVSASAISLSHSSTDYQAALDTLPMSSLPGRGDDEALPIYVYTNYNFTDVRRELELIRVGDRASRSKRAGKRAGKGLRARSASVSSGASSGGDSEIDVAMRGGIKGANGAADGADGDDSDDDSDDDEQDDDEEAMESMGSEGHSFGRSARRPPPTTRVAVEDRSKKMKGTSLPPGLRFPTGAVLGEHMIISGTYLANTSQTFSIWALHLPTMTWRRLDVGNLLSTGSWNRAVLWPSKSRLIIFGHRGRDLVADYNHRQTNWDHVLMLELEAWGIAQPPPRPATDGALGLGLASLSAGLMGAFAASLPAAADDERRAGDAVAAGGMAPGALRLVPFALGGRGDFEILCSDGIRLGCHRAVLERRWPHFARLMSDYRAKAARIIAGHGTGGAAKNGSNAATLNGSFIPLSLDEDDEDGGEERKGKAKEASHVLLPTPSADPRITPRHLTFHEPSPVVLALLQFLYTRCICTELGRQPAIVASLMLLAKTHDMADLDRWACHAAHTCLGADLGPPVLPNSPSTPSMADASQSGHGHGLEMMGDAAPSASASTSVSRASLLPPEERHRLAVAIYETAALCGHVSLQIRALRTVMAISKWVQRQSQSRDDEPASGGGSGGGSGLQLQTGAQHLASPPSFDATSSLVSSATADRSMVHPRWGDRQYSVGSSQGPLSPAAVMVPSSSSQRFHAANARATDDVDIEDEVEVSRATSRARPSKAERMLGIGSAEVASAGLTSAGSSLAPSAISSGGGGGGGVSTIGKAAAKKWGAGGSSISTGSAEVNSSMSQLVGPSSSSSATYPTTMSSGGGVGVGGPHSSSSTIALSPPPNNTFSSQRRPSASSLGASTTASGGGGSQVSAVSGGGGGGPNSSSLSLKTTASSTSSTNSASTATTTNGGREGMTGGAGGLNSSAKKRFSIFGRSDRSLTNSLLSGGSGGGGAGGNGGGGGGSSLTTVGSSIEESPRGGGSQQHYSMGGRGPNSSATPSIYAHTASSASPTASKFSAQMGAGGDSSSWNAPSTPTSSYTAASAGGHSMGGGGGGATTPSFLSTHSGTGGTMGGGGGGVGESTSGGTPNAISTADAKLTGQDLRALQSLWA